MARIDTDEPGRRIHSSIGLARPTDPAMYGYISEHHGYGMTREQSGEYAEDLAATMLATTLGIEFDPDAAWNERKRVYQTSNLIIGSTSLTAAAQGATRRVAGRAPSLLPSSASPAHNNGDSANLCVIAELSRDRPG